MKLSRWLIVPFLGCLMLAQTDAPGAEKAKRPPAGPLITIHAPHPQQFELALDEVDLDWSGHPGAKTQAPARQAAPIAGTRIAESQDVRATVAFGSVAGPSDLLATATALKTANPGAEAYLVLYEPGLPKSKATRRLLTREVALLMEPGQDPRGVLSGQSVGPIRSVPGVSDGYVVEAADPVAGLDLADALRQQPDVRSAYPLVKRQFVPR